MPQIDQAKVLIMATDGFEQSELMVPLQRLREMGATVHVASPEPGEITGWDENDWGESVEVDKTLSEANADDYDALVLPGGQINPDKLRLKPEAIELIKRFYEQGKTIAAICHAPWLLIEADLVRGRRATSYESIKTDMKNAGADWQDVSVIADAGIVTSRKPDDLEDFVQKIAEEVGEGSHAAKRGMGASTGQPSALHDPNREEALTQFVAMPAGTAQPG